MSVVVPTHERRKLVVEAVESIFAQSFEDFELIVVDDGSTDGTTEALAPYLDRLVYVWQKNGGPSSARNTGLKLARGEIVAFLDSDDLWLPGHLEVVTRVLDCYPKAVLVATSSPFPLAGHDTESVMVADALPRLVVGNFVGCPSSVAVRRAALTSVGGFAEDVLIAEDFDLWMRVALRGPFAQLARRTVVRRDSPLSLSAQYRSGPLVDQWYRTVVSLLDELTSRGDTPARLVDGVRGGVHFVAALRAFHQGDEQALRMELASACRLLPELGSERQLVISRLSFSLRSGSREDFLRIFSQFASAWPERSSPTSVAIRERAIQLALERGMTPLATRLLAGKPVKLVGRAIARRRARSSGVGA